MVGGQELVFDVLAGSTNDFQWSLVAPDGSTVLDSLFVDRTETLSQAGTYTLEVRGLNVTDFGTYSFQIVSVPAGPDEFTISLGDTVSDGVPAAGAGNLEGPGASDLYHFEADEGTVALFDLVSGSGLDWTLTSPDGTSVFSGSVSDQEAALPQTGTYSLAVTGAGAGTYSFRLIDTGIDEFVIAIGDTVSPGVPAPGAGNLEDTGAKDRYLFFGLAGQVVVFDETEPPGASLSSELIGPDGTLYFGGGFGNDTFRILGEDGWYELTVSDDVATYGLSLLLGPPAQHFDIAIGSVVSDGLPAVGAGNLEEPGSADIYTFAATSGQVLVWPFRVSDGLFAVLTAPDGTEISPTNAGTATLPLSGDYVLAIWAESGTWTGTYTFELAVESDEPPVQTVEIDVLAACLRGIVPTPVLIFGSESLDVTDVDKATVALDGTPIQTLFRRPVASIFDANRDGHRDLLVLIARHRGPLPTDVATLTATLHDGTPITGTDEVCPCHPWYRPGGHLLR